MVNSKRKGKDGELEWAKYLRDNWNTNAIRGRQYSGSPDSPDVISDLPIHWEVKRCERFNAYKAMEQAMHDSDYNVPVVAHRRNRGEWLLVIKADDFLELAGLVSVKCRER